MTTRSPVENLSPKVQAYLRAAAAVVVLALLLAGILPLAISRGAPGTEAAATTLLATSDGILLLREIAKPADEAREVVLRDTPDGMVAEVYRVDDLPNGVQPYATIALDANDAAALDAVRESWCFAPPVALLTRNDQLYEIAARCVAGVRHLRPDSGELPPLLIALVQHTEAEDMP